MINELSTLINKLGISDTILHFSFRQSGDGHDERAAAGGFLLEPVGDRQVDYCLLCPQRILSWIIL